jgi:four helix bundle protein
MDLAVQTYQLAAKFPAYEAYRLTAQVTRAVASVPANIAEGHARGSKRDYANFLAIAKGSLMETETFLMLALRLGYLSKEEGSPTLTLVSEISKMLTALRSRLLAVQSPGGSHCNL